MVITVEVAEQGINTRLVVTDLEQARTTVLYQHISCARGQAENDIKDHTLSLKSDRTACHRFEANQLRVLLHAAASVFLETLRREVFKTTPWAAATMETIQLRWRKLGARGQECEDRSTMSFPSSCPVAPILRRSLTLLACVRLSAEILYGSVKSVEGLRAKRVLSAQGGYQGALCLRATMTPICTGPGQPEAFVFGA